MISVSLSQAGQKILRRNPGCQARLPKSRRKSILNPPLAQERSRCSAPLFPYPLFPDRRAAKQQPTNVSAEEGSHFESVLLNFFTLPLCRERRESGSVVESNRK